MDMSLKFIAMAIIMAVLSLVCFLIPEFIDTDIPLTFLGLVFMVFSTLLGMCGAARAKAENESEENDEE